jgi:hypothetical protein
VRCGTSALTQSAARPARGGGVGDVSTREIWERRGVRFRGGVLTEAMAHQRGGRRQPTWWCSAVAGGDVGEVLQILRARGQ